MKWLPFSSSFFFSFYNCSTFQCILIVQKGLMNTTEIPQHTVQVLGCYAPVVLGKAEKNSFVFCKCFSFCFFIVTYSSTSLGIHITDLAMTKPLIRSFVCWKRISNRTWYDVTGPVLKGLEYEVPDTHSTHDLNESVANKNLLKGTFRVRLSRFCPAHFLFVR